MSLLLHPESLTSPSALGVLPSINSCLILAPGNTKYGGTWYPKAFPQPKTVTRTRELEVIAEGFVPTAATTPGAL